jgi:hypothetical protein
MSREVVQLSLLSNSTAGYIANNTAYGFTSYQLNYDSIFNGLNKKYRSANIRIHLQGTADIAKSSLSNAIGVVSLIGLGQAYAYSPDIGGLVINDLTYSNSSQISSLETGYYLSSDTRGNQVAPQVPTPQGTGLLTVKISTVAGAIMADTYLSRYFITILFECFDEVK